MKKGETKQKIIDMMYKLVAKEGYEKASIGKICKELNISKPAVYHYFNSKEEIFIQIAENIFCSNCSIKVDDVSKTTTTQEYKKELILQGIQNLNFWEEDLDLVKIIAELDLQTTRILQLKNIFDEYNSSLFNLYKSLLSHGVNLKFFEDGFDIDLYAQNLQVVHFGLISATLYKTNIDTKSIWKLNIENLPFLGV